MMPKNSWKKLASLQVALVAGLLVVLTVVNLPAVGQSEGTTTGTNPTQTSIPDNSEYNGMGQPMPVRKDAWTWYWDEKAHVETNNSSGFWGVTFLDKCQEIFLDKCQVFIHDKCQVYNRPRCH